MKGYSTIHKLPNGDPTMIAIDWMHAVCEGEHKKKLRHHLHQSNKDKPWYIGDYLPVIDAVMVATTPPDSVGRLPTPLSLYEKFKGTHHC